MKPRSPKLRAAEPEWNFEMGSSWSSQIFYTRPKNNIRAQLIELLTQDGFAATELHIPDLGSDAFLQILKDAEAFASEVVLDQPAWPIRAARWLHRIAFGITGKSFADLPVSKRQAITHATIVIAGHPEMLQ